MDSVLMEDWKKAYGECPTWKDLWTQCLPGGTWPPGVQLRGEDKQFLYKEGKLCVPEAFLKKLVYQWHEVLGHCGVEKMAVDMKERLVASKLVDVIKEVKKGCQVCQASEKPNWRKVAWKSVPVPEHPMMDISVDVVFMGEDKTWDGKVVDSCLVVVDRHSGWIQAYPVAKKA